jgi:hypothetical protein
MSSSASLSELPQAVSWLALGFRVPEDWEIVRHGIGFERGSLVFVDRARQRLSVSWTACPRAPDLERLLSDFESQPHAAGETVLSQGDVSGFRVLECKRETGERVAHALRFDPISSRLIELELPGLDEREAGGLARELLAGFAFSERARSRHLRAFGVHAEVPEGFRLCGSQVKPADVSLEFEQIAVSGERTAARLRIRRSGMARAWFDGDAARAIRSRSPELRFHDFASRAVGSHAATVAQGAPRGAILKRALGRATRHQVTFWECPRQNAVFETELCTTRPGDSSDAALHVWCCPEQTEEPQDGG